VKLVAAYAAWLATIVLGLGVVGVWSSALLGLFVRARLDKYAYATYNNAVVLVLLLSWLLLVVISEAWCRQSAQKGRLLRLISRLDGALAALVVVGYALYVAGF